MSIPTAAEFRDEFAEVFEERYEEARRHYLEEAWKNWTTFMTGKDSKLSPWKRETVLPMVAKNLSLQCQQEFMRLDLVFYKKGGCPLVVAIEHENDARDFETELERLFSIRSRLKVGINYAQAGSQEFDKVKKKLRDGVEAYWKYYVTVDLPEDPKTEYLFLLGSLEMEKSVAWHYLSFKGSDGPGASSFERS